MRGTGGGVELKTGTLTGLPGLGFGAGIPEAGSSSPTPTEDRLVLLFRPALADVDTLRPSARGSGCIDDGGGGPRPKLDCARLSNRELGREREADVDGVIDLISAGDGARKADRDGCGNMLGDKGLPVEEY